MNTESRKQRRRKREAGLLVFIMKERLAVGGGAIMVGQV